MFLNNFRHADDESQLIKNLEINYFFDESINFNYSGIDECLEGRRHIGDQPDAQKGVVHQLELIGVFGQNSEDSSNFFFFFFSKKLKKKIFFF